MPSFYLSYVEEKDKVVSKNIYKNACFSNKDIYKHQSYDNIHWFISVLEILRKHFSKG